MNIRKILYKSFDSILTEKEDKFLKEKLFLSEELRQKKERIEKLRMNLSAAHTGKFSSSFENDIKLKIQLKNYPKLFLYKELNFAFRRFVIAAILLITFLLTFNLSENGRLNVLGKEKITIGEAICSEYFYLAGFKRNF
jgi:hypothetical protein